MSTHNKDAKKEPCNKVARAKIFSYILPSCHSELLSITTHCSTKVNIKITALFPTSLLSQSQLSFIFSLLSHFYVLYSLFSLSLVPCDCSWWFLGWALVVRGFELVGFMGLIWWVLVSWLFCLDGLISWGLLMEGSETWWRTVHGQRHV